MSALEQCLIAITELTERQRRQFPGFAAQLERERKAREFEREHKFPYVKAMPLSHAEKRYGMDRGKL